MIRATLPVTQRFAVLVLVSGTLLVGQTFLSKSKDTQGPPQQASPVGTQIPLGGQPTGMALSPDGRTLAVLTGAGVVFLDVPGQRVKQQVHVERGTGSYSDIIFSQDGKSLFCSSGMGFVQLLTLDQEGKAASAETLIPPAPASGGNSVPHGLALSPNGRYLIMALAGNNSVAIYNLAQKAFVGEIAIGGTPYGILFSRDVSKLYVSSRENQRPEKGNSNLGSLGTGIVSVIDLKEKNVVTEIEVGLHPCAMILNKDGQRLFVSNANSDTVSVIDTLQEEVVEEISVKVDEHPSLGSSLNALALGSGGKRLYVALEGNSAIAVVSLGSTSAKSLKKTPSQQEGLIPTGSHPTAILMDTEGKKLFVANTEGPSSLGTNAASEQRSTAQSLGTVSIIDLPSLKQLVRWTQQVKQNSTRP